MDEDLQKEIDELGYSDDERALVDADLKRGDLDAAIQRVAHAQNSEVPGVTNGTLAKFRASFADVRQLKGEDGVRRMLKAMRTAAGNGHPSLRAVLDLIERETLRNSPKASKPRS